MGKRKERAATGHKERQGNRFQKKLYSANQVAPGDPHRDASELGIGGRIYGSCRAKNKA